MTPDETARPASWARFVSLVERRLIRMTEAFDPDRLDRRDPELIEAFLPLARFFNQHYFRLRVEGQENIPQKPAIFVSNHNGGISGPDLTCTTATLWERLGPTAPLYALAHDFAMRQLTPLGRVLQGFGGMRASQQNAERVLAAGGQFLVYPGGDLEAYRASHRRDEIIFGERTGFIKVAQKMSAPIVPIVAQGAHQSAYIVTDGEAIARRFALKRWARLERFPIALALPWGVALGPWLPYLPLPFPIKLKILAPIEVSPQDDPAEAREEVRRRMQQALSALAQER